MKLRFVILIFLLLTAFNILGQEVSKCDRAILLWTSEKVGQLNQKEMTDFLLTFGKECRNNAEYSEWSNELLFSVLNQQTELTMKTMEREEEKLEILEILNELSSPINDMIDIKNLIPKVERVTINKGLKRKMIDQLKIAHSAYD